MRFDFITDPYLRYLKSRHPFEYSRIIDGLYIAAWPTEEDVEVIKSLGVRLVICMDWVKPDAVLDEALGDPDVGHLALVVRLKEEAPPVGEDARLD